MPLLRKTARFSGISNGIFKTVRIVLFLFKATFSFIVLTHFLCASQGCSFEFQCNFKFIKGKKQDPKFEVL